MTLNWFIPAPPDPLSVGFPSGELLTALAKKLDITVWIDQSSWSSDLDKEAVRVRSYDPDNMPWAEINGADATIYHFAKETNENSPVWRISCCHPGVVMLHDVRPETWPLLLTALENATGVAVESADALPMIKSATDLPVVCLPSFTAIRGDSALVEAYLNGLVWLVNASLQQQPARAVAWISRRAGHTISPWFLESAAAIVLPSLAKTISRVFDE